MPWRIDEDLYVSGTPSARMLLGLPVTAVLTVSPRTPKPDALEHMLQLQIRHAHVPMPDGNVLHVERYQLAARTGWALLQDGHKLLIHCAAGRNRSVLIATMIMMKRYGWRGPEAIERIRELRPNALANPVTVAWLETFR